MPLWTISPHGWPAGEVLAPAIGLLAYLDPGTGSYALQLLMAGLFGGLFALKQSWADLKVWAAARSGGRGLVEGRRTVRVRPSNVARSRAHGQPTAEIE